MAPVGITGSGAIGGHVTTGYFVLVSRCIISSIELEEMRRSRRLQRGGKGIAPGHRARIHADGFRGFDVADFVADADRL